MLAAMAEAAMQTRVSAWKRIAVLLLIGLLLCAAFVVGLFREEDKVAEIPFDAAQWKSARKIDDFRTVRSQMVDHLLAARDFQGWSRSRIDDLLGPPDAENKYGWDLLYYLGLERGGAYSLDNEWLVFRLSADRVSEVGTMVD